MLFKSLAIAAAITAVTAQRPNGTSVCDYYTTALLKNNTAANQKTLLTLVVNTAVIGNYTTPNVGIKVPGILAQGEVNGTMVDLLPYFNGGLASTNTGGSMGMSVNFLDGGGAAPLMKNMPAEDMNSNQYMLLTHLYEYFGVLLGCTMVGTADYSAYSGEASMYEVHKFMQLSYAEVTWFNTQVAMSAASFGVATEDLTGVGEALNSLFNVRYAPPTTIIKEQGAQLQSICDDESCPLAVNSTMDGYNSTIAKPAVANSSLIPSQTASMTGGGMATPTSSGGSPSGTGSSGAPESSSAAAAAYGFSFAAAVGGVLAAFL